MQQSSLGMALASLLFLTALAPGQENIPTITHGPILGRPSSTAMGVWARTSSPASFNVHYGTRPDKLDQVSAPVPTSLAHDCTGWTLLKGLKGGQKYYYQLSVGEAKQGPVSSFLTLPDSQSVKNDKHNPRGLFNFRFEVGCCANQSEHSLGPTLPAYKNMLARLAGNTHFAIMNGDFIYEDGREFSVKDWQRSTGAKKIPEVVELAPSITGIWNNYKLYLNRGKNLAAWHRQIPSYFTFDDHEILNDVNGCDQTGLVDRRAVFRDVAVEAWYDYVGWSNPVAFKQGIVFGRGALEEGKDILTDATADFSKLDLAQAASLHVHWGTPDAGINDDKLDKQPPANPNAGVYEIVNVIDKHRLRIKPAAKKTHAGVYSIGRRSYYDWRVGNCHFFALDTRTHRTLHDQKNPNRPELHMIGAHQKKWLMDGMKNSDADFFFVVSSVDFMIYHNGAGGMAFQASDKDDAWTAFPREREELIGFFETLDRPVLIFTGDLHNSFAVKISERVWEFASAPHNSRNHNVGSEGGRPSSGPFNSQGRMCDIFWSSYFLDDVPAKDRKLPIYLVVQLNNVFNNPLQPDRPRWVAYPYPQVLLQYFNGITGDLLYTQSLRGGKNLPRLPKR